jgi:superfamily II DNA or RNA helicase
MRATLRDSITISTAEMPDQARVAIESALTVSNPHKAIAERELLWNRHQISATMPLFKYDPDRSYLTLPIGFLPALRAGCAGMDIPLELVDERDSGLALASTTTIDLRDYQEPMAQALITSQVGIGEAPTGAGKTVVTLAAIQRSGRNAIILVEKKSLADQWAKDVKSFLGIEPHRLGGKRDSVLAATRPGVTIALRQTIHAQMSDPYAQDFFEHFGTVVVDECHHAGQAWTLIDIIQRFTAVNKWGVSATPDRNPEYFPILQAVIGPVVWETTMEDAKKHLVMPSVRVLESKFRFHFEPTQLVENEKTGKKSPQRNNYTEMMQALCDDVDRNKLIAAAAGMEARAGHHVLINSSRTEHLKRIHDLLGQETDVYVSVYMLTGKDGNSEEIKTAINTSSSGTILLSTVADEGLSINRLDRVIPAFPRANPETMRQIVGRVMRPFPGKVDAQVIDIRDGEQFLLRSQFQKRAQQLYVKEGWSVSR